MGLELLVVERLAGLAEVAQILGVSKVTVGRYAARTDFPSPLERLAAGPIWLRTDIERWAAENLPLRRGRPRAQQPRGSDDG